MSRSGRIWQGEAKRGGLLGYRDWPRRRLHSPRTDKMTPNNPVTPSASSVHTKKKCPLVFTIRLATPTPLPCV